MKLEYNKQKIKCHDNVSLSYLFVNLIFAQDKEIKVSYFFL